jgi:hypothetical protein
MGFIKRLVTKLANSQECLVIENKVVLIFLTMKSQNPSSEKSKTENRKQQMKIRFCISLVLITYQVHTEIQP